MPAHVANALAETLVLSADPEDTGEWARAWSMLLWTFAAAGVYTLVSSRVAWLKSFPVFTWVGLPAVTAWGWDVTPSMGYIGQVGALLLSHQACYDGAMASLVTFEALSPTWAEDAI